MSLTETQPDGSGWPEALEANSGLSLASRRYVASTDEQLARAAGHGDVAAFEAIYERHHLQLLSFSRHMVGGVHDAEDVVQHTFIAADRAYRAGKVPKAVRAWLYTVARNRCISMLRARREEHELPDAGVPSTENLAADVERRADLRDLLADLHTLPDDQRAALLLSELGDLSHAEVAEVIGVRAGKVKALVFQARQRLMAAADARAIPCHSIREELAVATGVALRRRQLRTHLAQCEECSEFAARVRAQRASMAALLPVVPTIALRDSVLGALGSGGAAAAGAGGAGAGLGILAAKSTAAKVLTIAAIGGAAAGGGTVAVTAIDSSQPSADRRAERVRSAPASSGTAPSAAPAVPAADARLRARPLDEGERAAARDRRRAAPERARARDDRESPSGRGSARGQAKPDDKAHEPPGKAKQQARGKPLPPGKAKQQARGKPAPPGKARQKARAHTTPRGQAKTEAAPAPKVKAKPPAEQLPPAKAEPSAPVAPTAPAADSNPSNGKANAEQAEAVAAG